MIAENIIENIYENIIFIYGIPLNERCVVLSKNKYGKFIL